MPKRERFNSEGHEQKDTYIANNDEWKNQVVKIDPNLVKYSLTSKIIN